MQTHTDTHTLMYNAHVPQWQEMAARVRLCLIVAIGLVSLVFVRVCVCMQVSWILAPRGFKRTGIPHYQATPGRL